MIDKEKLADIRVKAEAATGEDWNVSESRCRRGNGGLGIWDGEDYVAMPDADLSDEDAEFIAKTDPETVLAMLDAMDEKDVELGHLRFEADNDDNELVSMEEKLAEKDVEIDRLRDALKAIANEADARFDGLLTKMARESLGGNTTDEP